MPKIICAKCKSIETVDEEPKTTESVLCSKCRSEAAADRSSSRRGTDKNIPRKQHGTRVMLPITCAECGDTDTLDYVPKGADLDEVLCRKCAREEFGSDSDWARIERTKKREAGDDEWEFECDDCGRTDVLPFEPKPDRDYQCNLCRLDHDTPTRERLADREQAAGGVFIRRGRHTDDN